MTKEEAARQEARDFEVFYNEVAIRRPDYTVTATAYGTPYDAIVDKPDLSNQLIEIKERWHRNSTDFDYYLIRKSKVDKLREICNEEKMDGYISYLFEDCWFLFPISTDYTTETKFVANPLYGDREEESYRLYPEQGTRLTYRNKTISTTMNEPTTERK